MSTSKFYKDTHTKKKKNSIQFWKEKKNTGK